MNTIAPDWVLPGGVLHGLVGALSTQRAGGTSDVPFDSLNLGDHVGDDPRAVAENRQRLAQHVGRERWLWLSQVHGTRIVRADDWHDGVAADGVVVSNPHDVAVIMTADCAPVLLATQDGAQVAAVHAGWRGLASGVVEQTIATLAVAPDQLLAWIGPAISQTAFEVGDDVRQAFLRVSVDNGVCFARNAAGRWQADLPRLVHAALTRCGVRQISLDHSCTYRESSRFFSHRRAAPCGRMATAIWRIAPGNVVEN